MDEKRRDAMKCEINKFSLPISECFYGFIELICIGLDDKVLKIYLSSL